MIDTDIIRRYQYSHLPLSKRAILTKYQPLKLAKKVKYSFPLVICILYFITLCTKLIRTCIIRRMVYRVVNVWPTRVVSFFASILRPEGEIWLRQEQRFLQTICRFLHGRQDTHDFLLHIDTHWCPSQVNNVGTLFLKAFFVSSTTSLAQHCGLCRWCCGSESKPHLRNPYGSFILGVLVSHHKADLFPGGQPLQELTAQLVAQNAGLAQATFQGLLILLAGVRATPWGLEDVVDDAHDILSQAAV